MYWIRYITNGMVYYLHNFSLGDSHSLSHFIIHVSYCLFKLSIWWCKPKALQPFWMKNTCTLFLLITISNLEPNGNTPKVIQMPTTIDNDVKQRKWELRTMHIYHLKINVCDFIQNLHISHKVEMSR
jgi:hypothetical protein